MKNVDGEDARGIGDAERVGRRAFLSTVSSVVGTEVAYRELRLAELIILFSIDSDDLGAGKAARVVFSAVSRGRATGSTSKQLGSRNDCKSDLFAVTNSLTLVREAVERLSLPTPDLFLVEDFFVR